MTNSILTRRRVVQGLLIIFGFCTAAAVNPLNAAIGLFSARIGHVPAGGGDVLIATVPIQETTGSSTLPSGSYINIAFGFAKTAVPSGSFVEIRDPNGTAVPLQQYDGVALYNDSSLRFATFKWKTPASLTPGGTANYTLYSKSGSASNSSSLATTAITAQNYSVQAVVSGVTYEAHINDYIGNAANTRVISVGPCCKEWRISAPLKDGGGTGTAHGSLWARFYVRLHEDNATIRIAGEIINSYVQDGGDISVTSEAMKAGSTSLVSYGAFTHFRQAIQFFGSAAKDDQAYWNQNQPAFCALLSQTDMQTANLIWRMRTSAALITAIGAATVDTYGAMFNDVTSSGEAQDSTGAHNWLGLIHKEDASALITGDKDWHKSARIHHMSSFAAPAHWYESANFNLAVLNHPGSMYSGMGPDRYLTSWETGATLTLTGGAPYYGAKPSHYPSWGKFPYITTGDHWWLDEMQTHAIGLIGAADPTVNGSFKIGRNNTWNGTQYYATPQDINSGDGSRGWAWGMRTVDDAEWLTPDNDPAKQYFKDLVTSTYAVTADVCHEQITNFPDLATLGGVDTGDRSDNNLQSPWQHDFVALVFATAIKRGDSLRPTTSHFFCTHHLVKWTLGRAVNGCAYNAYPYRMTLGVGAVDSIPPVATVWSDVDTRDGDEVTYHALVPGGGCPGSGVNFGGYVGGQDYPSYGHAAAWACEKVSITGASTIEAYLTNEEGSTTLANWAGSPQWYIRPNG